MPRRTNDDNALGAALMQKSAARRFSFLGSSEQLEKRVEALEEALEETEVMQNGPFAIEASEKPAPLVRNPGRPRMRPKDFEALARDLWKTAQSTDGATVSHTQLKQIAREFDNSRFIPPADYLERHSAKKIKEFNRNHSHSKVGPIRTWSKLVECGDKDHLRGMRRMLSRCAKMVPPAVRK